MLEIPGSVIDENKKDETLNTTILNLIYHFVYMRFPVAEIVFSFKLNCAFKIYFQINPSFRHIWEVPGRH